MCSARELQDNGKDELGAVGRGQGLGNFKVLFTTSLQHCGGVTNQHSKKMKKGAQALKRGKIAFQSEIIYVYTQKSKKSANKILQPIKEVGIMLAIGQRFKNQLYFNIPAVNIYKIKKNYILFTIVSNKGKT